MPWEVTVSYGTGASEGPDAILDASFQVDLNHQEFLNYGNWNLHDRSPEHWLKRILRKYKGIGTTYHRSVRNGRCISVSCPCNPIG